MPRNFTEEEAEVLQRGDEYEALAALPGWKRLLDELSVDADLALGKLRDCRSADDRVVATLARDWAQHERFLKELHVKVYGAVESRDTLLKEIAEATQTEEQQVESNWTMEEKLYGG